MYITEIFRMYFQMFKLKHFILTINTIWKICFSFLGKKIFHKVSIFIFKLTCYIFIENKNPCEYYVRGYGEISSARVSANG